jgi:plasmid maintenance system antidote protein VapI
MMKVDMNKLARQVGVSVKHIWCILNCKSRPSPNLAKKLEQVTGISRLCWLYPEEYPNPYVRRSGKDRGGIR